jgi:ankyrin repeat protein
LILTVSIVSFSIAIPQTKTDKHYTKFVKCVRKQNKAKAQQYINKGYNIDARDVAGKTILLYCLQQRNDDFAMFFIQKGADIHVVDKMGNTVLHYAIENGLVTIMTPYLIESGVDVNRANNDGYTPFHFSILYACNGLPFQLMDEGSDYTRITAFNENALHLSAESGCDTIFNFLIKNGMNIHLTDADGNDPLLKALIGNHSAMAKKLIHLGSNINLRNRDGKLSLFYAVRNNDESLVELLLNINVDLYQSENDIPYLYIAAEHENAVITEVLLRKGLENPMLCDIHDNCYNTAFIYSVNARIVPDDQKLSCFQNSLNIYKVAQEKYQEELNKIRARNTAKCCAEGCLLVGSAALGSYYYTPVVGVDYETERRNYLNAQIEKCKGKIMKCEYIVNCISQGQTRIEDCYE